MSISIYTLGVYETTEEQFFGALTESQIDTFCDIRYRRGMRGAKYSYVNSRYLQAKLAELGICYVHFRELAPNDTVRIAQKLADEKLGLRKRHRQKLSADFIAAYTESVLRSFDVTRFLQTIGENAERIVLFCVERRPEACHRSLIARKLAQEMCSPVTDITP